MKTRTLLGLLTSGLVVGMLAVACGADATPTPAPTATAPPLDATATPIPTALEMLIEEAKAEGGKIIAIDGLYDTPKEQTEAMAAMEAMFGMTFSYFYAPTPGGSQNTFTAQLIKEAEAGVTPSSDLVRGTTATLPLANRAGILEIVDWAQFLPGRINDRALGGVDYALATSTRIGGVQYNTDLVPPDAVPQTMEDLLDPRWDGLLASTSYAAVWDRASIEVDGSWDAPKAARILGILTELVEIGNLAGIVNCGEDTRIVSGEFAMLVFQCGDNSTRKLKAEGAPVDFAYLPAVSNVTNTYVSLLKGAQYPASAKLHQIFVQTEVGQALSLKFDFADSWAYEGNIMFDVVKDIEARGVPIPVIDLAVYELSFDDVQEVKALMRVVIRGG